MYYCMSKAALDQATRCMAMNFGRHGVRVNSVSPGIVRTEIHSKRDDNGAIRDSDTNEVVFDFPNKIVLFTVMLVTFRWCETV